MLVRSLALALPLAVGLACTTPTRVTDTANAPRSPAEPNDQERSQINDLYRFTSSPEAGVRVNPRDQVVAGNVRHVSESSIAIQDASGRQSTLLLVPQTQVTIHGEASSADVIRPGEDVRAAYAVDASGRAIATKVVVGRGGTTGASLESSWATGGMTGGSGGAPPVGRSVAGMTTDGPSQAVKAK